jgi:hypothetical protein
MYKIIVLIILIVLIFLLIKQPLIIKYNVLEDKQLPWCKKWNNNKGQFKCYINKHLQRKCYWGCNR